VSYHKEAGRGTRRYQRAPLLLVRLVLLGTIRRGEVVMERGAASENGHGPLASGRRASPMPP